VVNTRRPKEASQALSHVLGRPLDADTAPVRSPLVAELGGEHDLVTAPGDGTAHELLVRERGRTCRPCRGRRCRALKPVDGGDRLVLVAWAVELGHSHAAEALGGHDEALAECSFSHGYLLPAPSLRRCTGQDSWWSREAASSRRPERLDRRESVELVVVAIDKPEDLNVILGQPTS